MSVYTTVTPEELQAWLKNHYSLGVLNDLQGIASGIENTNYFVTTSHGRFVLTLFEKISSADLPLYIDLMAHLARHGIPCPSPIATLKNGFLNQLNGKPACMVSCLKGASLTDPSIVHCAQVGEMLANMHLAGQSYPAHMSNPRGPAWWRATAPQVMPKLDAEDAAMLSEELRFQALYRHEDLGRGVIHADLFRDNVLFDNDQLAGVIDFYYACDDVWLYDLAITVNDWCVNANSALQLPSMQTMLQAYHAVRPLTAIERGAWPVMLRAAALRFWLSRLYDYHFPRPGELTHAKDPKHFQRLLRHHIAMQGELTRHWV